MTDTARRARPRVWETPELPLADHIPEFANDEEAAEFYETHDVSGIMGQFEDVTDNPPWLHWATDPADPQADAHSPGSRSDIVSLRMPPEMIKAVKAVAARQQLPHRELIRTWVGERLAQEQERADESADTSSAANG